MRSDLRAPTIGLDADQKQQRKAILQRDTTVDALVQRIVESPGTSLTLTAALSDRTIDLTAVFGGSPLPSVSSCDSLDSLASASRAPASANAANRRTARSPGPLQPDHAAGFAKRALRALQSPPHCPPSPPHSPRADALTKPLVYDSPANDASKAPPLPPMIALQPLTVLPGDGNAPPTSACARHTRASPCGARTYPCRVVAWRASQSPT
jgi:hypothetical protein